jgi:hypothetical protein
MNKSKDYFLLNNLDLFALESSVKYQLIIRVYLNAFLCSF